MLYYCLVYDVFVPDFLYVIKEQDRTKNEIIVFTGSRKQCIEKKMSKINKPFPKKYWDWVECKNYLQKKYKRKFDKLREWLFTCRDDIHNGFLMNMDKEELDSVDDKTKEELLIWYEEFGELEIYLWW